MAGRYTYTKSGGIGPRLGTGGGLKCNVNQGGSLKLFIFIFWVLHCLYIQHILYYFINIIYYFKVGDLVGEKVLLKVECSFLLVSNELANKYK